MSDDSQLLVTEMLARASGGDRRAADELLPILYDELRRLARSRMAGERPGQTLQPTALVHEAYLRLLGNAEIQWDGRGHFFAAAAEAMRRILIERARRYSRKKHGGEHQQVDLEAGEISLGPRSDELLSLDLALSRLEEKDPTMAQVVKLRYFAGLTVPETAEVMGVAPRSVNRLWSAAKAWLYRQMARPSGA